MKIATVEVAERNDYRFERASKIRMAVKNLRSYCGAVPFTTKPKAKLDPLAIPSLPLKIQWS